MKYFLCGFSGAGKSSIGKELNETFNGEIIDLDEFILSKYPSFKALGDVIRDIGLESFRDEEFRAIKELTSRESLFIILGGGSLTEKTMDLLKGFKGLWLDTNFEVCFKRIENDPNRPLASLGREKLYDLYLKRKSLYAHYIPVKNVQMICDNLSKKDKR